MIRKRAGSLRETGRFLLFLMLNSYLKSTFAASKKTRNLSQLAKAHLALLAVALIYGGNYTIAKEVMSGGYLQPFAFIMLRVIAGLLLFSGFHRLFVRELVERKDLAYLALCGFFGIAANQMLFFAGLNLTRPINASLIMTTTPILVLVVSAIMLGERITGRKIAGISLGALGAGLLIAYGERFSFGGEQFWGDLMVFLNATAFGIYLVLVKRMMTRYQAITVVKWAFLFGSLFVLPFGMPQLLHTSWSTFTPAIILAVAYVLICTTFLAYLFNAFALSVVNASVVSIYIYLQPLFASLIALAFAKDELNAVKLIAGGMIFVGVYLVSNIQLGKKRVQKPDNT